MALLKDLIVQGAARVIGDAYFATVKAGVWNGTPIDLSHGGTALTSGTQTAGNILKSTATNGVSEWVAQSSLSVGSASRLSGTSSYTAWGQTYWSSGVPSTISGDMTSVGNITPSANVSKNCGSSSNAWNYVYAKYLTSNTTLWLTSGTGTSIVFCPAGTQCGRISPSGNLILGLDDNTTPVANNVTDKLYVNGATTITGTLTLSKTQDLAGTADNSPALIIGGPATGVHMEIDSNEIHAKLTGTTVAPLYLNNEGGLVYARGCALAEQSSAVTTAGKIFVSTTTEGRGEWYTGVTIAQLKSVSDWYDTVKDTDTDANINRWNEIVDFLNNFTEADTLASVLSTYVTLGTAQTITGAKTFSNPISGDLLGNATTADRLKSTTTVGGAGTPVYFTGGLPVACTAANVRTFLGLGTVYSHAHTDYITGITYTSGTRVLSWTKGGTANGSVTFGSNAFESYTLSGVSGRTIDASTAGYCAYYSAASTVSGTSLLLFDTTNSIVTIKSTTYAALEIWRANGNFSAIRYCNGETKTGLGYIGFPSSSSSSCSVGRPYWSTEGTTKTYYQIAHSTAATAVGGTGTPVYVDANGQLQACTAYSSASVSYATSAGQVKTATRSTNATHYLTFVDSDNSTATAESIYTDAGITYNPSTNLLTVVKLTASGVVNLSGSTTIDSLTAGSLIVTGASSLTGNVSMGTVTAGTWNGSVIDVAHGGTGCSTLTSGSALIGNGTGAVTFKAIDTAPTNNSSNLITSGGVYTYITSTLGIATTISPNEVTPSLDSARWTSTGINLYTADQGSYMLQISDTTTAAIFTGVFSIYHGSSATANALDEIPLHMCANTTSVNRIYAATLNGVLYVSSQDTVATQHHLTIKYKKLI